MGKCVMKEVYTDSDSLIFNADTTTAATAVRNSTFINSNQDFLSRKIVRRFKEAFKRRRPKQLARQSLEYVQSEILKFYRKGKNTMRRENLLELYKKFEELDKRTLIVNTK